MNYAISILILILGAGIGALADRFSYWFHVSRRMLWRKHCAHCFSFDAWMTYLPVLGFTLRRGVCAMCRGRLPIAPVLAEIAGALTLGFLWVFIFQMQVPSDAAAWISILLSMIAVIGMLVLAISDLVYDEVPFAVYLMTLGALVARIILAGDMQTFIYHVFAAITAGFVMSILLIVSKWQWVHAHDILFGIVIGFIVGWPGFFVTLAFAYIFAVIGGMIEWGWGKRVWKGASYYGVYLFFALAAHALLGVFAV